MDNEQFGLPEAPAAPIPEPIAPPQPPVDPAPAPAPVRPEPPAPVRVRRVGTFTMGLCLVIAGLALTVGMFRPTTDFSFLLKLTPLVLVVLGAEVLIASATAKEKKLKYDFLSMFVCFLLIVCAAAGAVCAPLAQYYGPQRQAKLNELRTQWNNALYEKLGDAEDVYSVRGHLWSEQAILPEELTLEAVGKAGNVGADVVLDGDYADETAFAAACQQLLPALTGAGVENPSLNFSTLQSKGRAVLYELDVNNVWLRNKSAAELAKSVETRRWNEEQGYYMDDEEWADWQQERLEDLADAA